MFHAANKMMNSWHNKEPSFWKFCSWTEKAPVQMTPEVVETFQYVKSKMQLLLCKISLTIFRNNRYMHSTAVQMFSRKAQMQIDVQWSDNNVTQMCLFVCWHNCIINYILLYVDCCHFSLLELRLSVLADTEGVEFKLLMEYIALWY